MNDEKTIEYDCECDACKGTGLYVGMGERDGAAVVCSRCKGTGHRHIVIKYREFEGRRKRQDVKRVFQANPGICIGVGDGHSLNDFGGIDYEAWDNGSSFEIGSENRAFTCPAWFYQSANYDLKPDWNEGEVKCACLGSFSSCRHFHEKEKCWSRFDVEQA